MRECGIYKIANTVTGDFYIGSACDIRRRLRDHRRMLTNNRHANRHLQNSWNKHGEQTFEFSTILLCDIEHKLYFEQSLLDLFKPPYNIALNAKAPTQGLPASEEHKRKISKANKGMHHTEETKRKISESRKGSLGHKQTEETRRKMSDATKGELNHNFGKHMSEEQKRKISEAHMGELNHRFGKHPSEETRRKISESLKRRYEEVQR